MYRVVLPVIDASFVGFGLASFVVGSKIVEDFIPALRPIWALIILLGALGALASNIFLWKRTEFFARLGLSIGLLVYAVATVAYMLSGNDSSILTLIFVEARLVAIVWRMWDIAEDVGTEEADREVIVARTEGTPTC
jgi:hypothetical protein